MQINLFFAYFTYTSTCSKPLLPNHTEHHYNFRDRSHNFELINKNAHLIVRQLFNRAKRYWYGTFVIAICLFADVSSGDTADLIGMPFGMVSGIGLGMGVLDFGGDRIRGRGSLG